jgi:hypothetical protein
MKSGNKDMLMGAPSRIRRVDEARSDRVVKTIFAWLLKPVDGDGPFDVRKMLNDLSARYLRANYPACYSTKQDIASLSGWNGLFYSFFCAVRKTTLVCRNGRNLSTSGDINVR